MGIVYPIILTIISNVASGASVIINKSLFANYNFKWPTTMAFLHIVVIYFLLECVAYSNNFKKEVAIPKHSIIYMSLLSFASFSFSYQSLLINSIGFFQVSRILIVLFTTVANLFTYQTSLSLFSVISLLIVITGIVIYIWQDTDITFSGYFYAFMDVLFTSIYHGYATHIKETLKTTNILLKYTTALPEVIISAIGVLFVDVLCKDSIVHHSLSIPELSMLAASLLTVVVSNIAIYGSSGQLPDIVFQLSSYFRSLIVFSVGQVMSQPSSMERIDVIILKYCGVAVALSGSLLRVAADISDELDGRKKLRKMLTKEGKERGPAEGFVLDPIDVEEL